MKIALLRVIVDASEYAHKWFLPWFPRKMHFTRTTHWWYMWRYVYPSFTNSFWTTSQFQSNLTGDFRSQYIKILQVFWI